ncbi:MAG: Lrp/AsnC ligand binding domain-containing protein [Luteibaculaceae bacterium]
MNENQAKNLEIDKIDFTILTLLQQDAKMPYTKIAEKAFVSDGTVHVRVKKMEQMGLIKGSTIQLNLSLLGYDMLAFIGVYLEKASDYKGVQQALKDIPEVIEAHYTTGNYSVFLKILCKNTHHLREVLNTKIQGISGVTRTETLISLETTINRPLSLSL